MRVARIDSTHGLAGELSARLDTDFPDRFGGLKSVHVGRERERSAWQRLDLEAWRLHRGKVLLKFRGVDDVSAAQGLVGHDVWIDAAEVTALPADTYYHRDLLGLEVRDRAGARIGIVEDILSTGGADLLVVRGAAGEVLIPAARSICVEVDLEAGQLVVDPPEGLLEVNAG